MPDQVSTPPTSSADDHAYIEAMETRRAASLRRRLMWFCIIAMFLMSIGMLGYVTELAGMPIEADPSNAGLRAPGMHAGAGTLTDIAPRGPVYGWWGIRPSAVVLFTSCTMMVVLFTAGLVYIVRTQPYTEAAAARLQAEAARSRRVRPARHRLIITMSWIIIGAFVISLPAEVIAQLADLHWGSPEVVAKVYDEPDRAAWTSMNAFGIFYCLACLTVPMRWRESLRIAVPGLGILMMSIVFLLIPGSVTVAHVAFWSLVYVAVGTAWSAWRYADFDARLRAHALGTRYTDLTDQVSEISAELREARRLHESLFPALAVLQGHPETPVRVSFRYEPARQIGGDFLDVYREPPPVDGQAASGLTIVVIDVSGHGVTAALAVNRLHGELRRFFARHPRADRASEARTTLTEGGPGHLLSELNAYTCAALAEQGIFATAMVVHAFPAVGDQPGLIRWASAGHPTGFLARVNGGIDDLASTATMLGVLPPEVFEPNEQSLVLHTGDRLITYTDGAVESRDAHGEDYTPERLRKTVADLAADPGHQPLLDGLMHAVRSHRHGRITDDTLLVEVIVASDTSPHPPAMR